MRNRHLISLALIFSVVLNGISVAVENPAVSNPVGTGRVPMSNIKSGLVNAPNPFDTSSNLIVTGQVSGGKHFRGTLPYNVDTHFGGRLGSTSMDSFLRYTAGTGGIGRRPGTYQPYYSPTATVTTTLPGYRGVIGPPVLRGETRSYAIEGRVDSDQTTKQDLQSTDIYNTEVVSLRPMSRTREQIEQTISNEIKNYQEAQNEADHFYQNKMQQFMQKLEQITERTSDLQQTPISQSELLQAIPPGEKPVEQTKKQDDSQMPALTKLSDQDKQTDVYQLMRQQLEQLQQEEDEKSLTAPLTEKTDTKTQDAASITWPKIAGEEQKLDSDTYKIEGLSKLEISAAAKTILGQYDSFAAYSKDKFNQYMRAAEMYLKQGKYYRAADSYTLATIYKPDDPLAYAGRSHALFAAGEYMSSAFFLSKALDIFPEYAWFKIDLVAMFDDKDIIENRIADIVMWVEENRIGQLQFLLAYLYYQMDRLDYAYDNVQSARMKMPNSKAVATLEEAIKDAMKTANPPSKD